jgi:hypothetical protein
VNKEKTMMSDMLDCLSSDAGPGLEDWLSGEDIDVWKEDLIDFFGR